MTEVSVKSKDLTLADAVSEALAAHGAWKLRLRTALTLRSKVINPAEARCDKSCTFGQWLHGPSIDQEAKLGAHYQAVSQLHRKFHDCAGDVLREMFEGNGKEATALMNGEFYDRSERLTLALKSWRKAVLEEAGKASKSKKSGWHSFGKLRGAGP